MTRKIMWCRMQRAATPGPEFRVMDRWVFTSVPMMSRERAMEV